MQREIQTPKVKPNREAGYTLIELVISIVIFLIFLGAVYGLLRIGNIQKNTVSTQTEIIKNVRLSLNTIGRDSVNAGLGYSRVGGYAPDNLSNLRMGLPSDPNTGQDLITAVMSGNDINTNLALPTGRTDVVSFAFRDLDFNNGDPIKMTAATDFGGKGVSVTIIPPAAAVALKPKAYDLYLVSDGTRTALGLVTNVTNGGNTLVFETGAADPLGINARFGDPAAEATSKLVGMSYPGTTAKKINWVSYRVSGDGVLIRTTYGNNNSSATPVASEQIQTQPIAYNIQNMQVRYLLRDGTSTNDPSNAGVNQERLNNVVQIDVTISARYSITENGVTINKVVDLNSTFSTKNLSYDIG